MYRIYLAIIAFMISGQAFGKTTTLHCHIKADLSNYELFIEIDESKKLVTELINGDSKNRLESIGHFSSSTIKWEVTANFGASRKSVNSSLDRKTLSLLVHLKSFLSDNREPSAEFFQKGICKKISSSNKL
jgi:hypothetical protein